MADASNRRAMIAKVHIARKDLALTEDSYRDLAERITSHRSAADCDDRQLALLLAEFKRLGWEGPKGTGKHGGRPTSPKSWVRLIWALWGDLKPLIGAQDDAPLLTFVARQTKSRKNPNGIDNPEWLDPDQARPVIEGLKGWLDRARKGETTDAAAE